MDFLLPSVAIFVLLLAGSGMSRLVLRNQPSILFAELFAQSFLLGTLFVSSALFGFGFFVSGNGLIALVTAACLITGWLGWRLNPLIKAAEFWPRTQAEKSLIAVNLTQIAIVGWLCHVRVLGWDGLLNYEAKARYAFLNGGALPLAYFSDPTRDWSHQDYPLLMPLTETWLYLWLGRADQELAKLIAWMFFVSAICMLHAANRRFEVNSWPMLIASLMIFTVPLLLIGDGSASSGYADFPMAIFYLATIIQAAEFWRSGNLAAMRLAGLLIAAGCWLKQEGIILWCCVTVLLCLKALLESNRWGADWRKWLQLALTVGLGLLVFGGWRWFIGFVGAPARTEVQPIGMETLQANAWLLPAIAKGVTLELLNPKHWGALWLLAFGSLGWLLWRRGCAELFMLALALLLPILVYASLHFFFPGSPLTRLLIHISLVAVLVIGLPASNLRAFSHNITHTRWLQTNTQLF